MKTAKHVQGQAMIRLMNLVLPAGILLLYQYIRLGTLSYLTADGRLYLSIADNFLAHGHFIQTARWFVGYVVPPGVPLILLVLRALGFQETAITVFQTCLFGVSCLLLGETEKRISGRYGLSPLFYLLGYMRCRLMLSNILVEHYYLFLLCVILWLVLCVRHPGKLIWMNMTGLYLLLTRPALAPVYLAILLYTLRVAWRRRKMLAGVASLLLPVLVLGINLAVNFRETGEYILLESYSGADLYVTACPHAPVTVEEGLHFVDETRDRYFYDSDYTMLEISRGLGAMARAYVLAHPVEYAWKTVLRCHELFLKKNAYTTLLAVLGALLIIHQEENRRDRMLQVILFGMNLLLTVMISCGLPEIRYTAVIWPLAALHMGAIPQFIADRLPKKVGG